MQKSKSYLPDVNVWLAFVADGHVHHATALRWMDGVQTREAGFCRITQMGLLRLLTNVRVMERAALTQVQAWQIYGELQRDERVLFLDEPQTIENRWRELTRRSSVSTNLWTDCYLRAFAELRGLRVVTFDRSFGGSTQDALLLA